MHHLMVVSSVISLSEPWDHSDLKMLQDSNVTAAKCRGGRGWGVHHFSSQVSFKGKTRAEFILKRWNCSPLMQLP